ncbi:hypothetical protein ACRRTK_018562 [Alexandromys fortis]
MAILLVQSFETIVSYRDPAAEEFTLGAQGLWSRHGGVFLVPNTHIFPGS